MAKDDSQLFNNLKKPETAVQFAERVGNDILERHNVRNVNRGGLTGKREERSEGVVIASYKKNDKVSMMLNVECDSYLLKQTIINAIGSYIEAVTKAHPEISRDVAVIAVFQTLAKDMPRFMHGEDCSNHPFNA